MIHFNPLLRQQTGLTGLSCKFTELCMPETYMATTLQDFVENRAIIVPTRKLMPPGLLFLNKAVVCIKGSVLYSRVNDYYCTLSDLTSSFLFKLIFDRERKSYLSEGSSIFEPCVEYSPRDDVAILWDFKMGPTQPSRQKNLGSINDNSLLSCILTPRPI